MQMKESNPDERRNTLGFQSAVVASLVLSVVSFLTTWSGLRAADPIQSKIARGESLAGIPFWEKAESLIITLGLAFGIQALMLALAWIVSRLMMVEDRKRWGLIASIFVGYFAATSISVTFSYVDLFDRMFSAQKSDWSAETIRERGDVIVEQLIEDLEDDTRSERSDFAKLQASFQAQINILSEASTAQRQTILAELDERRAELSAYRKEVGSARAEAQSAAVGRNALAARLEKSVYDFEKQVAQLTRERAEIQPTFDSLQAQSREKVDAKLLEERGAQESGQSGRGPLWRELDREHDIIKAKLEVAENRLERINRELESANKALLEGRQQLAIVRGGGDSAAIDEALDAGSDVRAAFLEGEVTALKAQADALDIPQLDFSSGRISEAEINQIESACTQIKSELIAAQTSGAEAVADFKPSQIDCTSGGAFETARRMTALQDSIADVQKACRASDSEDYANARGTELIQYIRDNCITQSALTARKKATYLEDLRRVSRSRDPEASPLDYSYAALQDREPQAIFALTLALAADLLILLVSLFGNAGHHIQRPLPAGRSDDEPLPASRQIERREPALFGNDEDD
jgi:hypothetical protein